MSGNAPTHVQAAKSVLGDEVGALDDFREVGVGYATAKNGTPYWCTILARQIMEKPRAVRIRERQNKEKSDERHSRGTPSRQTSLGEASLDHPIAAEIHAGR